MPGWVHRVTPAALEPALFWLVRPAVLSALAGVSFVLFIASALFVPRWLAHLPEDYLTRSSILPEAERQAVDWLLHALKNALGALLFLLGVLMLILPGQGLLTMLLGLFLLDIPGKRRFMHRLIARPPVLGTVNALRKRLGAPPLHT